MKVTINGREYEGTPAELYELEQLLQGPKSLTDKVRAALTPTQREVYDVVVAYPEGVHYEIVAEFVTVEGSDDPANAICARLASLEKMGVLKRIQRGTYALA